MAAVFVGALAIASAAPWAAPSRAGAQESAPPPPPPPAADPPGEEEPPATLDDLLEIRQAEQDSSGESAHDRDSTEALKRRLEERAISDSFKLAIEKMSLSADLLDRQFDTGLGTQRVQEEILAKLDQLLDQAKRQQQSSSSSRQNTQGDPKQSPGRKPQDSDAATAGDRRNNQPNETQEGEPPALQQGELSGALESTGNEWGNLPERVREMLLQGRRDKYSSLYRRLTDEYYKRLAEEESAP
jgi:hypothetical protein